MAKKIQIPSTGNQQITALHSCVSNKRKTAEIDPQKGTPVAPRYKDLLVLMAHGFPGHMAANNDLYGDLESILAEKGCDSLRFDFRGCGKSEGRPEDFTLDRAREDFRQVLVWATQQGYKYFIYIGEGFGATLCVMNLVPNLSAAIFLWPVFDLERYYKQHFAGEKLDETAKKNGYIEKGGEVYGLDFLKELKKSDLERNLEGLSVPTLIMHGAQDKTVPMEHIDMAKKLAGSKRMEISVFQDGEHGLQKLTHRKMMFYHITQFVEKYG